MAMKLTTVNMNIDAAGTAERVTADTAILASSIHFEALRSNSGIIYVGLSDVSSTDYIAALAAGESFELGPDAEGRLGTTGFYVADFYIDASVNDDDINVTYAQR